MLVTNGPRWFDRTTPDPRWPSFGVSLLMTAAMFATALVAMRSFAPWGSAVAEIAEKPLVLRLVPPAPPAPPPRSKPVERHAEDVIRRPSPATIAVPVTIPAVITPQRVDVATTPFAPAIGAPRPLTDSTPGAGR